MVAVVISHRCPPSSHEVLLCGTHRSIRAGIEALLWRSDAETIDLVQNSRVDAAESELLQLHPTLRPADPELEQEVGCDEF